MKPYTTSIALNPKPCMKPTMVGRIGRAVVLGPSSEHLILWFSLFFAFSVYDLRLLF